MIGNLDDLLDVLLQDFQGAQLLLLILDDGLRGNHLLRHAGSDQHKVLLADLNATLLGVELADAHPIAGLFEVELLGLALGKLDHVQPGDVGGVLSVRFEHTRGTVEEALEALDQDGSQGTGAQVTGDALVAVQDAVVFADQVDDGGHVVIGGDQGKVIGVLTGEIVDLQVIRVGFGDLGGDGREVTRRRSRSFAGRFGRRSGIHVAIQARAETE